MADIGQAYVQIIPTAKGISSKISGAIAPEMDKAGNTAGKKFSSKFAGVASVAVGNLISTGVTKAVEGAVALGGKIAGVGKQALDSYANYEQLIGGVEKLFGDANRLVENYASNAYRTSGMSANEYMETVTSFSASLISSLEGNQVEAARIADIATQDMSDNINVFSTDIELVKNAYAGFAKGNFTMLDNLKLGYSGTASEMVRLVNESGILEEKVTDIADVSYDEMILAIHAIQEEMNITGTTANEAAQTIQGSTNSMRAAWENLLVGFGDENADLTQLANDFINTLITPDGKGGVLGTILPRISKIISSASEAIAQALPQLVSTIAPIIVQNAPVIIDAINQLIQSLLSVTPELIQMGIQLITSLLEGMVEAIPQISAMMPGIIQDITEILVDWLPDIIIFGGQIIVAICDGIVQSLPTLTTSIPAIIGAITETLLKGMPDIIEAGLALFTALVEAMPEIIKNINDDIPEIVDNIVQAFVDATPELTEAGVTLFLALLENLPAILEGIETGIETIIEHIVLGFLNNDEELEEAGTHAGDMLAEGISNAIAKIPDYTKRRWSEVAENTELIFSYIGQQTGLSWENIRSKIAGKIEALKGDLRGKWESIKSTASNTFQSIKNVVTAPIEALVNIVSGVISRIRNLFHFSVPTPHIPVPHFSISPAGWTVGNLLKGSIPHLSVNWYAQAAEEGALFTTPQIIGVGDAAQPELLLGERKLRELLNGGNTVNNYITVNGAEDPEAWAGKFAKQLKLEMRMA